MKTRYKQIPGWPGYVAGSDGSVWSNKRGCWSQLSPSVCKVRGRKLVELSSDGKGTNKLVHHLILLAFRGGKPFRGAVTRHLNGDASDNRIANLVWGTCKENSEDRAKHGTTAKGERSGSAKLKEADVKVILKELGRRTMRAIARDFGVSDSCIHKIKRGGSWRHLR